MFLVGTSGFRHRDWAGTLYPPGLSPSLYLRHFAKEFPLCELTVALPSRADPARMAQLLRLAGSRLTFTVLVLPSTGMDPDTTHEALEEVVATLVPLRSAGRLGAVVLPMPRIASEPLAHSLLLRMRERLGDTPFLVEPGRGAGSNRALHQRLREAGCGWVLSDGPGAGQGPPASLSRDAIVGYVRFHGRGGVHRWAAGGAARRDYLYRWSELVEWLPLLRTMERTGGPVYLVFNNPWGGRAVANARMMQRLLAGPAPGDVRRPPV